MASKLLQEETHLRKIFHLALEIAIIAIMTKNRIDLRIYCLSKWLINSLPSNDQTTYSFAISKSQSLTSI